MSASAFFSTANHEQYLLQRVCYQQDQQSLVKLLQRHRETIAALTYRMGKGQIDPEEFQQELYLVLLDKLSGAEPPRNFKAWLGTLIRNRVIDGFRHQKTIDRYQTYQESLTNSYVARTEAGLDEQRLVDEAMQHLNEREQEVIRRFYLKDQTYQEIADDLGYTFKQVTGLMYRALKRLRSRMKGYEGYFSMV